MGIDNAWRLVISQKEKEREDDRRKVASLIAEYLKTNKPLTGQELIEADRRYLLALACQMYNANDCQFLKQFKP